MENVLDVYCSPYDPSCPTVCFDEASKEMHKDVRETLPASQAVPAQPATAEQPGHPHQPGHPRREDSHYERNGVSNIYMHFEPLAGRRHVKITEQHTRFDFAECMKELVDVHYPQARLIRVVMDNLSAHKESALYEVYEPQEAKRILDKLEFHRTPKHGSWLNMAEIELSVLGRQCLNRRIPNPDVLRDEIAAWQAQRNEAAVRANWQFTTADARIKLKKLYPSIDD